MLKEIDGYISTLESLMIPEEYIIATEARINEINKQLKEKFKELKKEIAILSDRLLAIVMEINHKKFKGDLNDIKRKTDQTINDFNACFRRFDKYLSEIKITKEDAINSINSKGSYKAASFFEIFGSVYAALSTAQLSILITNRDKIDPKMLGPAAAARAVDVGVGVGAALVSHSAKAKMNNKITEIKKLANSENFANHNIFISKSKEAILAAQNLINEYKKAIYDRISDLKKNGH